MAGGFSIMQYLFMSFWSTLMARTIYTPNYTILVSITLGILENEPEPSTKKIKDLKWVYEHTGEVIDINVAQLETLVFHHIKLGSGLNKELDINEKTYKIIDLIKELDSVVQKLVHIVIGISKKYSLDIPFQAVPATKGSSGLL